jgi:hypothetical protein
MLFDLSECLEAIIEYSQLIPSVPCWRNSHF